MRISCDPIFDVCVSPSNVPGLSMRFNEAQETFEDQAFATIVTVVKLAWKTMEQLFRGNRVSENYFAKQPKWINPGIIDQIADPVGAALTFNRLISQNIDLLENSVDAEIIRAFQGLILKRGPQDRLLSFFCSICSCQVR